MIYLKDIQIGFEKSLFSIEETTLEKGRLYSLIGKNGSGKTTFIETVIGELQAFQGEVFIDDEAVQKIAKKDRVSLFAHVMSKAEGVQHLTVKDLIGMGRAPYTNLLGQLSKEDKEVVQETIQLLGLEDIADKDTLAISDGERQIAMIGKALAQESQCILLDEPTAFLDYTNRMKVMQILKKIAIDKNKIVLISSHDLDLSIEHSDTILAVNTRTKRLECYQDSADKQSIISEIFL